MDNPTSLAGKTAIVTGARTGIGQACAIALAKQGASVILASRTSCEQTQGLIEDFGGTCIYVSCDVSRPEEVEQMVQTALATYGRLDIAINNAGCAAPPAKFADQEIDDFDHVMAVDARGVFLSMKYEIPAMLETGGGSIVNISSVAGLIADPQMGGYVAAKHAVVGMTRAAAIDYAEDGIRVNCICPGFTHTEMSDYVRTTMPDRYQEMCSLNFQKRASDPSEIAAACLFLASDMASFVTGAVIPVDAGQTAH